MGLLHPLTDNPTKGVSSLYLNHPKTTAWCTVISHRLFGTLSFGFFLSYLHKDTLRYILGPHLVFFEICQYVQGCLSTFRKDPLRQWSNNSSIFWFGLRWAGQVYVGYIMNCVHNDFYPSMNYACSVQAFIVNIFHLTHSVLILILIILYTMNMSSVKKSNSLTVEEVHEEKKITWHNVVQNKVNIYITYDGHWKP